jgi:hypothetical protein
MSPPQNPWSLAFFDVDSRLPPIWVLLIRQAHALSVTVGHSRPGRGVTDGWQASGSRRQPVFGRPSASGEKWPALTAAGGRVPV